jgi:hypothetical protein
MPKVTEPPKAPPATPQTDFGEKVKAHQRYFTSAGEQVPGVTTILGVLNKPALISWANRMGLQGIDTTKYVDEAAAVGTLAHAIVVETLGGAPVRRSDFSADQIVRAAYGAHVFSQWAKAHTLEPLLLETPLVSDEYRYGGTIDILGDLDGKLTLIDLKTSSGIYEEHVFQVGAYWKLLEESGQRIAGARILRIGRTEGEAMDEKILSGVQILNAWRVFEHCLEIYRLKKRNSV